MMRKFKKIAKIFLLLFRLFQKDFKRKYLHQWLPIKPIVINMMANDICNSKCVMCNIWQQKQDIELSPQELETVLRNSLFSEVRYVGITGGEPTMRDDLPALYEAVCRSLPQLDGISGITNAIKSDKVIETYIKVNDVAIKHGKSFGFMVSLDGYGNVHDEHRGRPGNFESALRVIKYFKENTTIPVSIGCTITKTNVWKVDELLDFLIKEKIYGRFRIGEFINRLYNHNRQDEIRNFNADERYHLMCFFQRLLTLTDFEMDAAHRRTYRNIIAMLEGNRRQIACPYQDKGVVLDSRGNLQYCAPKSKPIGSSLGDNAVRLFKKGLKERRRVLREDCLDCIHDYHAEETFIERWRLYRDIFWTKLLSIDFSHQTKWLPYTSIRLRQKHKLVFIVGWYGTETVGDKAILGGIINHYKKVFSSDVSFAISSIVPFVTERTLIELGAKAAVIPIHSFQFWKYAAIANYTVMGGGPLMDLEELSIPLAAFRIAHQHKRKTIIFGCGIGPLKNPRYVAVVEEMLAIANEIMLRDQKSALWARSKTDSAKIKVVNDPAFGYISDSYLNHPEEKKNYFSCFLRDWTEEYQGDLSDEEFLKTKKKFEIHLANAIKDFCLSFNLIPRFYSMHTFVLGGDDRTFYRRYLQEHFTDVEYYFEEKSSSVDQIAKAMLSSSVNLCMRFHSVLFAHVLNTNFIAIDYTQGGKIKNFLEDNDASEKMYALTDIASNPHFSLKQAIQTF